MRSFRESATSVLSLRHQGLCAAQVALDLLLHNAEYHLALGFAKIVRYCSPADLRAFLRNTRIHELLASDKLDLVLWDSMAECRCGRLAYRAYLSFCQAHWVSYASTQAAVW